MMIDSHRFGCDKYLTYKFDNEDWGSLELEVSRIQSVLIYQITRFDLSDFALKDLVKNI